MRSCEVARISEVESPCPSVDRHHDHLVRAQMRAQGLHTLYVIISLVHSQIPREPSLTILGQRDLTRRAKHAPRCRVVLQSTLYDTQYRADVSGGHLTQERLDVEVI